jgi:phage gp46-like protein
MSDIQIQWDKLRAVGDWSFEAGDLQTGVDIETAVLVSLFTDRIASTDFKPTDGTKDRRGWWGDSYNVRPIGSRLWQLERAKKVGQQPILLQARDYCKEALAWLIEDGLARSIEVKTEWTSATSLGILVRITRPDGTVAQPFRFSWAWAS